MNWNVKFFMRLKELRWSVPRLVEEMNIEGAKEANAAADRIRKWRPKDDRRPIAHPHDDGMLERAVIAMGKSMDWLSASQHTKSTTTNVGAGEGMNAPVNDNVNLKLPQQLIGFIPQRVPLPSTAGSEEILVYGLVNGGQAVEI